MAPLLNVIFTFSALCGSTVVSGILRGPRNVRLSSYNMDLVLSWDPPEGAAPNLLYTTGYTTNISLSHPYEDGCVNISALRCDFTDLNIPLSEYGKYTGRVRVQSATEHSDWVESNQITMDMNTIIGPPTVSLMSNGPTIEVSIEDPVFRISALRNAYSFITYNITFWKDGEKEKARSMSNIQQNRVVLSELDLWTKYCVQVQINTNWNITPSELSGPVCESTTSENTPWVAALVTFVVMAVVVIVVAIAVVYRKRMSYILCPNVSLPPHLKEQLMEPPSSFIYLAMLNSKPPEETYHQVSFITDGRPVVEEHPPEAAENSSSRQLDVTVNRGVHEETQIRIVD
ncbi:interleukin-10 receptor subunit beta-like isoform X2 [Thalassophryne amazonica]|uniref:interleukin-10 receptor subunit beta-like isoform X2 n=1 Tax=Thalassophryne amazonica TaxID=390379 RepID=UPI0014723177|nr:interleukin-10 receptor subunit beta-like isoform X2 [Thalassophryne amazonica]